MHSNTQLFGQVAAVHARTPFHATAMARVPMVLTTVPPQNRRRACFVFPRCPPDKKELAHASTWAPKNAHHASSLTFLASALMCFADVHMSRARQVRCCRTHLNFSKLFFRRYQSKRMMPDRKFLFFKRTTPHLFVQLPFSSFFFCWCMLLSSFFHVLL